jgi:hypothetical protein
MRHVQIEAPEDLNSAPLAALLRQAGKPRSLPEKGTNRLSERAQRAEARVKVSR